ncbi:IPIL1 protein, partial [Podargus strigoides]|nr:IPIL1 protein [Podargus strigoides]
AWNIYDNSISYYLTVFLHPPPGHSFSLDMDTTEQLPERHTSIRVALECTCSREQLLGDILCFLHHPENKVPQDQSSVLLCTLCTDFYLDKEKVTFWAQCLLKEAWMVLPQSRHCQLMVLPSSLACSFQLAGVSKMNFFTELSFAVQQSAQAPTNSSSN